MPQKAKEDEKGESPYRTSGEICPAQGCVDPTPAALSNLANALRMFSAIAHKNVEAAKRIRGSGIAARCSVLLTVPGVCDPPANFCEPCGFGKAKVRMKAGFLLRWELRRTGARPSSYKGCSTKPVFVGLRRGSLALTAFERREIYAEGPIEAGFLLRWELRRTGARRSSYKGCSTKPVFVGLRRGSLALTAFERRLVPVAGLEPARLFKAPGF
jgi:hypothetical protein